MTTNYPTIFTVPLSFDRQVASQK